MDGWLVTGAVVLQFIHVVIMILIISSIKPIENATRAQKSAAKMQWYIIKFAIILPVQAMITLLLVCGLFVPY